MSEFILFYKENILIIADINDNIIVYDIVIKTHCWITYHIYLNNQINSAKSSYIIEKIQTKKYSQTIIYNIF